MSVGKMVCAEKHTVKTQTETEEKEEEESKEKNILTVECIR